jgi:hypothetical protein
VKLTAKGKKNQGFRKIINTEIRCLALN